MTTAATVFALSLVFWLLLDGQRSLLGLTIGVLAAAAVAALNRDQTLVVDAVRSAPGLLAYLPWLFREIVRANLEVVRLVLDPRLPIDPVVVRLPTRLPGELALTALANSITLTPGTVTLDVEGTDLIVHALTPGGARQLLEGAMARRVAAAFGGRGT
jgi:multicomponent Na+:H+ antiporter subunit E